jgi:5-formyltetrahydrofolate cyclo-ligase
MAVPPPSPFAASDAKPALRRTLRRARAAFVARLTREGRIDDALAAAADHAAAHVPPGASVALYHAFGTEIDPTPLAALLAARGIALALPHVSADHATMRFLAWHPASPLAAGAFGLSQPDERAAPIAPTVIVTPLVGFDRAGGRIGQGGGFYDRAFAALPGAIRIGYAWSAQEADEIPRDPWDVPLHAIATEKEWILIEGEPT